MEIIGEAWSTRKIIRLAATRRYGAAVAAFWTCVLAGLCGWRLVELNNDTQELAYIQASDSFHKDLIYRRWASGYGGVYVPVTEKTQPNPYLAHVDSRDVTTISGLELTLVNPAYMTRQVHEMGREQYGHQGHITSLNPVRPENSADPWEAKALKAFVQGVTEVVSLEPIGEAEYLRLMRPLVTEESCLKCHAGQGYKIGDVRGGISVSVPMSPLRAIERKQMFVVVSGYGMVWLLGIAGIIAVSVSSARRARKNEAAAEKEKADEAARRQNQKLASIGTLAAGIAHEINNPINGIMNYAQLIKDKSESGSAGHEYASEIILETERVARIASTLLAFSKQDGQARSLARMTDIVESVVSLLRSSLAGERIHIEVEVPGDLPKVQCHSQQIQQVIMNLIMNARDALNEDRGNPEGNNTILVSAHLLEKEDGKLLRTTVEDHGCGIPQELRQRIFDPFFTTKDRATASGLGLSTSQMIARNHNGELILETETGEYTRFHLDLPANL